MIKDKSEVECSRKLLIEKRFAPDYVDDWGQEIWVDRYGVNLIFHEFFLASLFPRKAKQIKSHLELIMNIKKI